MPIIHVFAELEQPIKALPISAAPYTAGSFSHVLPAPRPNGVFIRDPVPETTRSGLERPYATRKGKGKMIFDPIIEEDDDDLASVRNQIICIWRKLTNLINRLASLMNGSSFGW